MPRLRRSFSSRKELIDYVSEQFPEAVKRDASVSDVKGGRKAAERILKKIDPARYRYTRGKLGGAITQLSPYIRHGVMTLAEVRDFALERVEKKGDAWKLISQMSWRDYFQRVYEVLGNDIYKDFEPYKTGLPLDVYSEEVPQDLRDAKTGAVCIDSFVRMLTQDGFLPNTVRLWLAAYTVHWRRVRWQAGAQWWLEHLLDGDPAANALGWQWVASTWRYMPYTWNRGNLVKKAGKQFCDVCPLLDNGCPFQGTYASLAAELFEGRGVHPEQKDNKIEQSVLKAAPVQVPVPRPELSEDKAIVWVHGDGLNPYGPALAAYPDAKSVWVWDEELLSIYDITLKRLVFLYECLTDLPVQVRRGDVAAEVSDFAEKQGAKVIATTYSPSPRFAELVAKLSKTYEVQVWPEVAFAEFEGEANLSSHKTYWQQTKGSALHSSDSRTE